MLRSSTDGDLGGTIGFLPKGCPTVSSQICPTPDPESCLLVQGSIQELCFPLGNYKPFRAVLLPGDAEVGGGGQYRSGQGRSSGAAGTTQLIYRERSASAAAAACVSVCARKGQSVPGKAWLCPWKTDPMADTQLGPTQSSSDPAKDPLYLIIIQK